MDGFGTRMLTEFPEPGEPRQTEEKSGLVDKAQQDALRSERRRNALQEQLKSAVEERRKPVRPIKEPHMELKNMVATKGIQWALCAPMVSTTMLWSIITPFSTMTCRPSGRFFSLLPSRMLAVHRKMVTIRWETVVWVMGMPPKIGISK